MLLFITTLSTNAQSCYRVSDAEKVSASSLVVEGVITSQQPFWNTNHTFIFTNNTVHIFKVFKGSVTSQDIEIVTQGGEIDGFSVSTSDLLTLNKNELGLFCCHPSPTNLKSPSTGNTLLNVYAGTQGFFKYNLNDFSASTSLSNFKSITSELYPYIKSLTGKDYEVKDASFSANKKPLIGTFGTNPTPLAVPKISSFSPDTIVAGATLDPKHNTFTIKGSGFGPNSSYAAVWFTGTDYARWLVNYNDPLLVSWSDTLIVVKVPNTAGTGKIWVENSTGVFDSTTKQLYIPYSVQTATYKPVGSIGVTKELSLMNHNGKGGYTFLLNNSSLGGGMNFDSAARTLFTRSLKTWQSRVGFNAIIADTASSLQTISGDNINMVMFDNANTGYDPLPAGTLGNTYYYATICTPTNTSGYKKVGFDVLIRSNHSTGSTHFSFGPCPPIISPDSVYDLESTIFHELGHAIGLAHVRDGQEGTKLPNVNPGAVMNGGLSDGARKISLDNGALVGATYLVTPKNNSYGGTCFGSPATEMIPLTVGTTPAYDEFPRVFPLSNSIAPGTSVSFDLVNATSNKYTDPQPSAVDCSGNIMAITNNAYYPIFTSASGGKLDISVTGYTTLPIELASCNTSGIQLALYQLNSKPQAHNYPAPVACRKFNGDSTLTSISGLLPSTSYLLFLEGINNTKANFNLTLGGQALPIIIKRFAATASVNTNLLNWALSDLNNVYKISIEKSNDGNEFKEFTSFTNNLDLLSQLKDFTPFAGITYYRMVITYTNGKKEYSNIASVKRTDKVLFNLYPNPVMAEIKLQLSTVESLGNIQIKVLNVLGQVVANQTTAVSSGVSMINIPANNLSKGYYHLLILNKNNEVIQNINMEKQ